ncbi:MAG: hypothetical protein JO227_19820, partial [Acetobacteraceae bacterium]|nr:hypothetical protein [Acetobacteraceae bacterium]
MSSLVENVPCAAIAKQVEPDTHHSKRRQLPIAVIAIRHYVLLTTGANGRMQSYCRRNSSKLYSMRNWVIAMALASAAPVFAGSWPYPDAHRDNVVDTYNGVQVGDPYRWLEDPDSAASKRWISEENALTQSYLASVPGVAEMKERLKALWSPVVYPSSRAAAGVVVKGGRYFFLRRDSGKNQPVLYWMESRKAAPKPLLDPNTLSKDGTAALLSWSVSNDGKMLAYGIARAGSDWQDVRFRRVDTGEDAEDKLEWIKFSEPEWNSDGNGVYYGRFPRPAEKDLLTAANYNQQLCFHKLGTAQSEDKVIYERPDHKDWMFGPEVSEDGRYLVITVSEGTRPENLIFYRD